MYIRRKVYSLLEDENGEQRLFSTTEIEPSQKEFAWFNYAGLTKKTANSLQKQRNSLAKQLKKARKTGNIGDINSIKSKANTAEFGARAKDLANFNKSAEGKGLLRHNKAEYNFKAGKIAGKTYKGNVGNRQVTNRLMNGSLFKG